MKTVKQPQTKTANKRKPVVPVNNNRNTVKYNVKTSVSLVDVPRQPLFTKRNKMLKTVHGYTGVYSQFEFDNPDQIETMVQHVINETKTAHVETYLKRHDNVQGVDRYTEFLTAQTDTFKKSHPDYYTSKGTPRKVLTVEQKRNLIEFAYIQNVHSIRYNAYTPKHLKGVKQVPENVTLDDTMKRYFNTTTEQVFNRK